MKVLLFGILAEKAGVEQLELSARSTHELRRSFIARFDGLKDLRFAIAVDRMIVHEDMPLHGGEEIALLPPFAGG